MYFDSSEGWNLLTPSKACHSREGENLKQHTLKYPINKGWNLLTPSKACYPREGEKPPTTYLTMPDQRNTEISTIPKNVCHSRKAGTSQIES